MTIFKKIPSLLSKEARLFEGLKNKSSAEVQERIDNCLLPQTHKGLNADTFEKTLKENLKAGKEQFISSTKFFNRLSAKLAEKTDPLATAVKQALKGGAKPKTAFLDSIRAKQHLENLLTSPIETTREKINTIAKLPPLLALLDRYNLKGTTKGAFTDTDEGLLTAVNSSQKQPFERILKGVKKTIPAIGRKDSTTDPFNLKRLTATELAWDIFDTLDGVSFADMDRKRMGAVFDELITRIEKHPAMKKMPQTTKMLLAETKPEWDALKALDKTVDKLPKNNQSYDRSLCIGNLLEIAEQTKKLPPDKEGKRWVFNSLNYVINTILELREQQVPSLKEIFPELLLRFKQLIKSAPASEQATLQKSLEDYSKRYNDIVELCGESTVLPENLLTGMKALLNDVRGNVEQQLDLEEFEL